MSEPIVVGIDGSEESDRAVLWAAAEAVLRERPLHIVHALESWPYRAPLFMPAETTERMTRTGHRLLTATRERLRERWCHLEVTTALVSEEPSQALQAQSGQAYELVVGSRGRGGFAGMLLGSTSLRVAARPTVPVVIVRGDTGDRGEIVVGIDLLRDVDTLLDYAFETAALRDARLRVVHAWQTFGTLIEAGYAIDGEQIELDLRGQVIETCEPLRAKYPRVDVVDEIIMEHPVTALSHASRNARLLVIGAHQRRWTAPQLGSIAHGVIHHARCPVAVIPSS
ncbi:universal stress protein [Actinomadura bangladeshensis]|uniref:Universal stress protein n=1 Tax=Actinomadura bangladeshensis TaxID=453573 RepID=A0A4R4PBA8_9ACTN|nr:universal stress protein [Actinomadura bangladeshensis]TDC18370.1 universal stress protein [Actinomadura bangladeshensis]